MDKKLVYYDLESPGGYGGVKRLKEASKQPKVEEWLSGERTYTLHKPARRRMSKYRSYKVLHFGYQFQADLNDMIKLSKHNKGYKYIMTVIDIFTRFAWAFPLKTKTGKEITSAFKKIGIKPKFLQTDQGTEFYNASFKKYLAPSKLFSVFSPQKAAIVERFNRTLKTKMYRYFTHKNTSNWVDILDKLINTYNNTKHSSLPNMSPQQARSNWWEVWNHSNKNVKAKKGKLQAGDHVRLSKFKGIFEKGFTTNWSEQIYQVKTVDMKDVPVMYEVQDYKGEKILGKFYQQELQKVSPPDIYPIEKVFKRKDGRALVKFLGYPEKYWVDSIINNV